MVDFLDSSDIFQSPMTGFPNPEECYESDWLKTFLDDPVLNDRMMTEAMQPPCIKSEHSYSINDNTDPGSPLGLAKCEDLDADLFGTSSALDLTMKTVTSTANLKVEENINNSLSSISGNSNIGSGNVTTMDGCFLTSTNNGVVHVSTSTNAMADLSSPMAATASTSSAANSLIHGVHATNRQPTIIVTTTTSTTPAAAVSSFLSQDVNFPAAIQIKQEPSESEAMEQSLEQGVTLESIMLPPTPPGSSGSDSDGSQSPQRSAPSSPIRHSSLRHHPSTSSLSPSKAFPQPLFVNPISQSGVLILSEEEKRTLISEGYPIPSKLPLTKQEEKNLKKIRRKIKNKISAQESRRKKKEYLEALEKRVEAYNHENNDLKKKVENLENSNRSLLGQLQKLQSLVKMSKATASQTGTALMVLVFCFAVFLGSMSPSSLNIGYSSKPAQLGFVSQQQHQVSAKQRNLYGPEMSPMMMTAHDTSDLYSPGFSSDMSSGQTNDPYATPKLKSRMLMSIEQEEQCEDFRPMPWDSRSCPMAETEDSRDASDIAGKELQDPGVELLGGAEVPQNVKTVPDTTVVMVMANLDNNNSKSNELLGESLYHETVVPDVTRSSKEFLSHEQQLPGNFTAELETA